jgi:hypothetical protein
MAFEDLLAQIVNEVLRAHAAPSLRVARGSCTFFQLAKEDVACFEISDPPEAVRSIGEARDLDASHED